MRVTPQDKKEVHKVLKALKKLCNQFLLEDDNRLLFEQYIKDFKISEFAVRTIHQRLQNKGTILHHTSVKKRSMKKGKLGSLASPSGCGLRVLTRKDLCLVDTCFFHFIKRIDGTGICWYWM
ncbi:hypothetical protein Droror1_Dr00004352 [Drosera rotundifolia]